MKILKIAVPVPFRQYFDYLLPEDMNQPIQQGMRIKIPFGKRELVGLVMGSASTSSLPVEKLKEIIEIIDDEPILPDDIIKLCLWAADYYHYPIGEVLFAAIPTYLRKGKSQVDAPLESRKKNCLLDEKLILNSEQLKVYEMIQAYLHQFQVFLLDGVTGSGKTEIYLQVISDILKQQKQILVLVPEIGLTPQTIQRFSDRFSEEVFALHSKLTQKERFKTWMAAKTGEAKIIIGTRSAIWTPFKNLGLIIVDEEHDISFKQQEGFRYHARDLAIVRAQNKNIPILLGSATPALETLHNATQRKWYQHCMLEKRAGNASLPEIQLLDVCKLPLEEGMTQPLLTEIEKHLKEGNQVMLFLNRRGFAPVILCHACGWMAHCKRCDARMTFHQLANQLHCHHCDTQKRVPTKCEACGQKELLTLGLGTERLENVLEKYFSEYTIARIDKDNTKQKGSMEKFLEDIHQKKYQILIGTQMLAKGHHFPDVTLVAIIDADGGFFSSDFRALERMGQLLLQVAGRAGRMEKKGKVILQTHHPNHPLLHQLLRENYREFAYTLLKEREEARLPPYLFLAILRGEAHQESQVFAFLQKVKTLTETLSKKVTILGPIPATMPKKAGRYRLQLLIQSTARAELQHFLKTLMPQIEKMKNSKKVRWSIDVDPMEMG